MKPPFTVTNSMLNKVVGISKTIGNLEFQIEKDLKLRKEKTVNSFELLSCEVLLYISHL